MEPKRHQGSTHATQVRDVRNKQDQQKKQPRAKSREKTTKASGTSQQHVEETEAGSQRDTHLFQMQKHGRRRAARGAEELRSRPGLSVEKTPKAEPEKGLSFKTTNYQNNKTRKELEMRQRLHRRKARTLPQISIVFSPAEAGDQGHLGGHLCLSSIPPAWNCDGETYRKTRCTEAKRPCSCRCPFSGRR